MIENQKTVIPGRLESFVSTVVPFYEDDYATIYHGDCRLILPFLGRFDLLLTDPPYGIGADKKEAHSSIRDNPRWADMNWDAEPVDEWVMMLARQICDKQIIFGGNYYTLPPTKCWLVWEKQWAGTGFSMADAELAWTNFDKAIRVIKTTNGEAKQHPTQKPLEVVSWALGQAGNVKTVLDPWMGSGTTLRAAKDAGLKVVGIEREKAYCQIAIERLRQEVLL